MELTTENIEMSKAITITKEERAKELLWLQHRFEEEKSKIKENAYSNEYALRKRVFTARFIAVFFFVLSLVLVGYIAYLVY